MDYYIIPEIFSFSDEINKRVTTSEFKYKSEISINDLLEVTEISINDLLEASHHKKNLASLKYFNYLRAKENTKPIRHRSSFYCIIQPKKTQSKPWVFHTNLFLSQLLHLNKFRMQQQP